VIGSSERAVLLLALLIRVAGWLAIAGTPFADTPLVDAYTYWAQAQMLLDGGDPFSEGFYQPPAYPMLLWAVFSVAGTDSPQLIRALQAGLGVLTTWLLMRSGRALGERVDAPQVGVIAGLVYTLYPSTLLFELDLLTPAVTSALFSAALFALLTGPIKPLRAGLAGLALGGAASFHPTTLLAALACAWAVRGAGGRSVAALGLGCALALAPTTGANLARFGRVSLVSQNDGLNFYLGNNPDWRETATLRAGLEFRRLVLEADPASRTTTFERNDYWRQRSREAVTASPWSWLDALVTKAAWSVNDQEIPRNEDYRCRTQRPAMSWLSRLPVSYGLAFPFAALGAALLWRRRDDPTARLVPLSALALHLPLILFLVADRYRLATWPAVALLAGLGIVAAARGLRARPPLPAALAFGALALLPWLPIDDRVAFDPGWCLHQDANFAYAEQDYTRARNLYRAALSYRPDDLSARSWLGRALLELDQPDEAVEALAPLVAAFPESHPSLVLISQAYARSGDRDAAADHMGLAYRTPGPRANTGARYVELLVRADRAAEARAVVAADPDLRDHPRVKKALDY